MRQRGAPNLFLKLDPHAREGLQQQLYAGLRRAIVDGLIGPGTRIPSSRSLADDMAVSRTTAVLAVEQLLAEGYLVARSGSGTFVADELPDEAPETRPEPAATTTRHPPLSRRGSALAAMPPPARRANVSPRPFRLGTPALDAFPVQLWARLATRRLADVTATQLDYSDIGGLPSLREAIAAHVRVSRGARCDPSQVHVCAGGQRGLELLSRILLDPGDAAAVEDPGYPGAWATFVSAGARVVPIPVDEAGLVVAQLARRRERPRVVYLTPSHQFPLGVPMSLARRMALLKWAASARAWLIEDDYDSEFRHGTRPMPCLQGLDRDGRVIYLGSFSKAVFPALRLGFLIVPPDLQEQVTSVRQSLVDLVPFFDQAVLADFIREGHFARHLRRMRGIHRERLQALASAARRHCAGVLTLRPLRTGLHAVADLKGADATAVFEEARARGVEVMPIAAYAFGRRKRPVPNALVLGVGAASVEAIERGMKALRAAIETVRQRS